MRCSVYPVSTVLGIYKGVCTIVRVRARRTWAHHGHRLATTASLGWKSWTQRLSTLGKVLGGAIDLCVDKLALNADTPQGRDRGRAQLAPARTLTAVTVVACVLRRTVKLGRKSIQLLPVHRRAGS